MQYVDNRERFVRGPVTTLEEAEQLLAEARRRGLPDDSEVAIQGGTGVVRHLGDHKPPDGP